MPPPFVGKAVSNSCFKRILQFCKIMLDIFQKASIISNVPSLEDLCNGSTPDSDSVCGGSNPSSSATKSRCNRIGIFYAYVKRPADFRCGALLFSYFAVISLLSRAYTVTSCQLRRMAMEAVRAVLLKLMDHWVLLVMSTGFGSWEEAFSASQTVASV